MANHANDKRKRQQEQQEQRRIDEQQQRQDRDIHRSGQGGQDHTNRPLGERHPGGGSRNDDEE